MGKFRKPKICRVVLYGASDKTCSLSNPAAILPEQSMEPNREIEVRKRTCADR